MMMKSLILFPSLTSADVRMVMGARKAVHVEHAAANKKDVVMKALMVG